MIIKRNIEGKEYNIRLTSKEIKDILNIDAAEKGREIIQRAYDNFELETEEYRALYGDRHAMRYMYEELVEEAIYNSSSIQREIVKDYAREVRRTV